MHWPQAAARKTESTMEASLIHGDDDSCREADRLIAELSAELCVLGDGDIDSLIAAMLARIGDAAGADAMTFISTGGGASLEFLEGDGLPGVTALLQRRHTGNATAVTAACRRC